jgi:outer membrane receptor protein involved in Fe transport
VKTSITVLALSTALVSHTAWADSDPAAAPADQPPAKAAFTTGVAKGRDLLDTAISASTLSSSDLQKIGTTSIGETVGNIPGIRVETAGTDGMTAITIRGLPLAADGAKYLQLEEDGLPVLEFGDIRDAQATQFLRTDLSLAQVQAIRGGSASTFASNSPGGVVNFLSRTGEENGGLLQISSGLNYGLGRVDFDYGGRIDDHWRYNIGGFYRQGEGPRGAGYAAFDGGQIKFNVTRSFDTGYVRLYVKVLDDREPSYSEVPVTVAGTDANPQYAPLPGMDARNSTPWSRYVQSTNALDANNSPQTIDLRQGNRSKVHSIGLETQFDVAGWTVTDRFRYAAISGTHNETKTLGIFPAGYAATLFGGPGGVLSYADGPLAGQVVADPATLNGNGIAAESLLIHADLQSLNTITNDFRASRVFALGEGKLTTTGGLYASSQDIKMLWSFTTQVTDFAGGGNSTLLDVTTATGIPVTQQGTLAYTIVGNGGLYHREYDVNFRVLAPYASANYQLGRLSVGGSLRYDFGKAAGTLYGSDLGGTRVGAGAVDFNGDGKIGPAEAQTAVLPLSQPGLVSYNYHYLSWSAGANYRFAEALSAFARYSIGARASADRNLYPPTLNPATGQLYDPADAFRHVKQAEAGVKFRHGDMTVFVTGFWASVSESNDQLASDAKGNTVVLAIDRTYSAKGVELESDLRKGPFSLRLGATYTKAKIDSDANDPTENGLTPRHEPSLFITAMPQFETRLVSIGANVIGVSSSYAQDTDLLKQPGYVLVNPFIQVRPIPRVTATLNVYNLFNKLAFVQVDAATVPASGVVPAQVLNGRTVTASVRFSF